MLTLTAVVLPNPVIVRVHCPGLRVGLSVWCLVPQCRIPWQQFGGGHPGTRHTAITAVNVAVFGHGSRCRGQGYHRHWWHGGLFLWWFGLMVAQKGSLM